MLHEGTVTPILQMGKLRHLNIVALYFTCIKTVVTHRFQNKDETKRKKLNFRHVKRDYFLSQKGKVRLLVYCDLKGRRLSETWSPQSSKDTMSGNQWGGPREKHLFPVSAVAGSGGANPTALQRDA